MNYRGRRDRLIERFAELRVDAFLVTRPANVRYLTGFTGSNGQLLLGPRDGVLLTDGRYTEQAGHEVPDLRRVTYRTPLAAPVAEAVRRLGGRRVGFETTGVTYRDWLDLSGAAGDLPFELVPLTGEVEALRKVKEPVEVRLIETAQAAAERALDEVVARMEEGRTEREVALELDTAMRRAGADGVGFDTIVAFGENAAEPHHEPTDRPLKRGDVVEVDFGALVEGYHSDMTRTLSFGGLQPALAEVYQVVLRAHRAGVDRARPGVTTGELDRAARSVIEEAGYGEAFSHPLGHGVGLEIHEAPFLRTGGDDVVPAGAVITIEPGVYLPGLGGVRIEDMVEVTEDGPRPIPRTSKELVVL